jgi:hypothetical protein
VPKPESIEEALALEDWQIVHRAQKKTKDGDVLVVITRDGSKAAFPVVKSGKKVTASNGAQATA